MKLRITLEGKKYDVEVELLDEAQAPPPPPPVAARHAAPPLPPIPFRGRLGVKNDERHTYSPLAGVVVQVTAAPGQKVAKNDLLLVLEAMKMETRIVALGDAVVKQIPCKTGDGVKPGQLLVEFD